MKFWREFNKKDCVPWYNFIFNFGNRLSSWTITLPKYLEKLTFGHWFIQNIKNAYLSQSLTHLTFGWYFNQEIKNANLPESLIDVFINSKKQLDVCKESNWNRQWQLSTDDFLKEIYRFRDSGYEHLAFEDCCATHQVGRRIFWMSQVPVTCFAV